MYRKHRKPAQILTTKVSRAVSKALRLQTVEAWLEAMALEKKLLDKLPQGRLYDLVQEGYSQSYWRSEKLKKVQKEGL